MSDGVDYSKMSNEELRALASGSQSQQAPAQPQSAAALQDVPQAPQTPKLPPPAQLHPALGALGGSYLGGMLAGPATMYYASRAASDVGDIKDALKASQNIPNVVVTGSPAPAPTAAPMTGGEKWGEKITGAYVPGAQMDKEDLDLAKQMKRTVGRGGELAGGTIHEGILLGPKAAGEHAKKLQHETELEARIRAAEQSMQQRAAAAAERSAAEAAKPSTMSRIAAASVPKGAIGKMVNIGIPTVSLGLAGAEGVDAWNRWNRGGLRNKTQAVIGGLGALGSAASMFPHPVARIGGTALSMGAPALNAAIDYIAPPEEQSGSVMPGVQPSGMGGSVMQGYADGGTVANDQLMQMIKASRGLRGIPENQYMPSGAQADLAKRKAELQASGVPGVFKSAAKETYENPIVNTALAALPISGEAMLAGDVADQWQKGDKWTAGGMALAGLLPFGGITKNIKPETLAKLSKYFDESAIEAIKAPLDYKSRATTVLMSPDEFLGYAAKTTPDKRKMADIESRFAAGDKIGANNLPFLQMDHNGNVSEIIGHEGRHRANYLRDQGVDLIPVNVKSPYIRWSEQADPKRFDYVGNWPQTLKNQDLTWQSPFPFNREGEYLSTAANKETLPDRFWNKEMPAEKTNISTLDALEKELSDKAFEKYFNDMIK